MQKMACGALIVALRPTCCSPAADAFSGDGRASWIWLLAFFVDLHARRALHPADRPRPVRAARAAELGATTVAAWFLAIFTGSLAAGQVGRLWSHLGHVQFFVLLAAIASARGGPAFPARPADQADTRSSPARQALGDITSSRKALPAPRIADGSGAWATRAVIKGS